jgi:hypothetical protein
MNYSLNNELEKDGADNQLWWRFQYNFKLDISLPNRKIENTEMKKNNHSNETEGTTKYLLEGGRGTNDPNDSSSKKGQTFHVVLQKRMEQYHRSSVMRSGSF